MLVHGSPEPSDFLRVQIRNSEGTGEPAIPHVGFALGGNRRLTPMVKFCYLNMHVKAMDIPRDTPKVVFERPTMGGALRGSPVLPLL